MIKKTYIQPEVSVIKIVNHRLMITASGGEGSVNLNYTEDNTGNANEEGLARGGNLLDWSDDE